MKRVLVLVGFGLLLVHAAEAQDDLPAAASTSAPDQTFESATSAGAEVAPIAQAPASDATSPATAPADPIVAASPQPDVAAASPQETKLAVSPLYSGPYVVPSFSYSKLGHNWESKDGLGGEVAVGYRLKEHGVAFEVRGQYSELGSKRAVEGGTFDALVFPFANHPIVEGIYGVAGGGYLRSSHHPEIQGSFGMTALQAGIGYLFGLPVGNYDLGIRAEVLGRHDERSHVDRNETENGPRSFNDIVFNIGLQLPLGRRKAVIAPEPVVAVVPPVVEVAPPQPPKPECHKPAPGEQINLNGCGAGDVIVLNGVNFEFNEAKLAANAKTILDQVASELLAHSDIKVELAGHTDGKGSESYNLKLSQRRAESVRIYFMEKGIDGERMTAVGYGKTQPIADNDTEDGRAQNRRTELRITASNGEASLPVTSVSGASDAASSSEGAAQN